MIDNFPMVGVRKVQKSPGGPFINLGQNAMLCWARRFSFVALLLVDPKIRAGPSRFGFLALYRLGTERSRF